MANENNGFAKLMRFCATTADFDAAKTAGTVTDDVLVIVVAEKLAKFKGETFDWSGGGGSSGGVSDEVIIENEEVTAAALVELNDRVNRHESDFVKYNEFSQTTHVLETNSVEVDEIAAAAFADLNNRIERLAIRISKIEKK